MRSSGFTWLRNRTMCSRTRVWSKREVFNWSYTSATTPPPEGLSTRFVKTPFAGVDGAADLDQTSGSPEGLSGRGGLAGVLRVNPDGGDTERGDDHSNRAHVPS